MDRWYRLGDISSMLNIVQWQTHVSMEKQSNRYPDSDPELGKRSIALTLAGDLAPRQLGKPSYEIWMQIVRWKLAQKNTKARDAAEDLTFQDYLDTGEIHDSAWVYEMELAVKGDARKVLAEVFAIAKKILLEGNGNAKFALGTQQSLS